MRRFSKPISIDDGMEITRSQKKKNQEKKNKHKNENE